MKRIDICSTADENYALLLKVLIVSVVENNKSFDELHFHLFETGMTNETIQSIKALEQHNVKIYLYDVEKEIQSMKANVSSDWAEKNSYMTYARLYMPTILPKEVEKFVYLDSDTTVIGSLDELAGYDLNNCILAGVKDTLPYSYKKSLGYANGNYINAGVLLIDRKKWNSENITKKILKYCYEHPHDIFADQDAINAVLKDRISILPPKYCVFYPENSFSYKSQIKGYGDSTTYYSEMELLEARTNPVIIHFVDTVLGRPWQSNNINPYSVIWKKYFKKLAGNEDVTFMPKKISKNQKIFRFLYKILPKCLFSSIYYNRRNKGIDNRIRGGKK